MGQQCLFCGCDLDGQADVQTVEHIVARVLVGRDWLLTDQICGPCNNFFGTAVDKVGASHPFVPFAQEVGLEIAPSNELEGIVYLEDGSQVRVQMGSDGTSRAKRKVDRSSDDREITVTAETAAVATQMAQDLADKAKRRRGREILWSQPQQITGEGPTLVAPDSKELGDFPELLPRVVAKIAIEYIGLRYGAELALDPLLDPLRAYARYGTGDRPPGFLALRNGDQLLYFPRTNQLHQFRQSPGEPVSDEAQLRLAIDETGRPLPPPPEALHLTEIEHRIQLWRDEDGLHFSLLMFSTFWAQLELPVDLPIQALRVDVWDFSRRRQLSRRG